MSEKVVIVAQTLSPVPDLAGKAKPQGGDLSPAHQKELDEVLAHFDNPDYKLPVKDEQDATLTEEEKFWLVRLRLFLGHCRAINVLR